MAYTALNLITDVLLDMGVIADGATPTAVQSAGALTKLNDLIESWNLDPQKVYGANEYVEPFVVNQQVYTIGLGGDFNIPRPTQITSAFIRQNTGAPQNQFDYPLEVLNNMEWQDLLAKRITSTFPYAIWFDEKFPLIEANVSPIPTGTNYSLVIWANGMNGELALNTVLSLPPGYKRALKYALFLDLAPSYQIEVPASIALLAQTSMHGLDVYNTQLNELAIQRGYWFDIRSNRVRD
jgi:hypothetical protein